MHRASNCFRPSILCLSVGALSFSFSLPLPLAFSLSLSFLRSLCSSPPLLFYSRYHLVVTWSLSLLVLLFSLSFYSSLYLAPTVLFWIDGRRRPCFFSRPETPTHSLVACESAIRWDGGNGISLLTRDCCRRRPPCFLLLLRFFLLPSASSSSRCRSPRLLSFLFSPPRRRPVRWNSPKFFAPANKHHRTVEDGPARKSRSVNSLSVSPSFAPFPFDIYFLLSRWGRGGRDSVYDGIH